MNRDLKYLFHLEKQNFMEHSIFVQQKASTESVIPGNGTRDGQNYMRKKALKKFESLQISFYEFDTPLKKKNKLY